MVRKETRTSVVLAVRSGGSLSFFFAHQRGRQNGENWGKKTRGNMGKKRESSFNFGESSVVAK